MDSLTRLESPPGTEILLPWKEGLPHLAWVLVLGCLVTGRKRS